MSVASILSAHQLSVVVLINMSEKNKRRNLPVELEFILVKLFV